MKTDVNLYFPDPSTGCTCGPYWSVVPPPPCPHHTFKIHQPISSSSKELKELAESYRRMADALDPPTDK